MNRDSLFIMSIMLLLFSRRAFCQTFYKPSALTVRMGETLPENFYQEVREAVDAQSGKTTTIKLADYRDKLIILDFWANWCKPCIGSIFKLDSIGQQMNDDRFIVIPVTQQSGETVKPLLNRFRWHLTSVVSDSTLSQIFPYGGLPHQVWVKDGKVFAIPKWHFATAENIRTALEGGHPYMMSNIQDLVLDPIRPMFTGDNGKTGLWYTGRYAKISRYLPDYRKERVQYARKGDSTILFCNNQPIEQLFYQAYKTAIFPYLDWHEGHGMNWQISDTLRKKLFENRPVSLPGDTREMDSLYQKWQDSNRFGYELRYPENLSEREAHYFMQQDLNSFFGVYLNLRATVKPGPRWQYAVLRVQTDTTTSKELLNVVAGGWRQGLNEDSVGFRQLPFGQHFQIYLAQSLLAIPGNRFMDGQVLVDSTGLNPGMPCSFVFPKRMWGNLEQINQELKRYGMQVTVEEKNVPVLYIQERGYQQAPLNQTLKK